ncbi:MAG: hypothetical protein V2A54_15605 [Bacteroidota bacterium]
MKKEFLALVLVFACIFGALLVGCGATTTTQVVQKEMIQLIQPAPEELKPFLGTWKGPWYYSEEGPGIAARLKVSQNENGDAIAIYYWDENVLDTQGGPASPIIPVFYKKDGVLVINVGVITFELHEKKLIGKRTDSTKWRVIMNKETTG